MLTDRVVPSRWLENIYAKLSFINSLRFFRVCFGIYFLILNIKLIIGVQYILGDMSLPKTIGENFFKSHFLRYIYNLPDNFYYSLIFLNIVLSILFALSKFPRIVSFILWLSYSLIFIRLPSVRSVHIDYIGWLMLLNVLIPSMTIPDKISNAAWIFFSLSYLFSGLGKLRVNEWFDGQAISYIMQTGLVRHNSLSDLLTSSPKIMYIATYAVMIVEIFGIFLIRVNWGRWIFLIASAIMHMSIMIFLKIADLSTGMLVFHIFLFATLSSSTVANKQA